MNDLRELKVGNVICTGITHKGIGKLVNQDNYLIDNWDNSVLAVISDGIGGYRGGEIASQLVIDEFKELTNRSIPLDPRSRYDALVSTVQRAQESIRNKSYDDPELEGMGATVVACLITEGELIHVYVGDSRLYYFGIEGGVYITRDQNISTLLLSSEDISEEDIKGWNMGSLLSSCLWGLDSDLLHIEPEWDDEMTPLIPLSNKDVVLLSTDGFHKELDKESIEELCISFRDSPLELNTLGLSMVLDKGGKDDITIITLITC